MTSEKIENRVIRETSGAILQALASLPDGPSWLATQLKQESFISNTYVASTQGYSAYDKVSQMIPAVEVRVRTSENPRQPFLKFIGILRSNPALVPLAQSLVRKYRGYGGVAELPLGVGEEAGAVPRNRKPGELTIRDLPILLDKLQLVAHQWMSLGIQLEFDPNLLQIIRTSVHHDPTAALQELITRWVQRLDPPPLLESLAEAIRGQVIGNPVFAKKLLDEKADFPSIQEDMGIRVARSASTQSTGSTGNNSSQGAGVQPSVQERELDEGDLVDIADYLSPLNNLELYNLGVLLGLSQARVQKMKEDLDMVTFCDTLITAWLSREDYVLRRGVPQWSLLAKCLRHTRFRESPKAGKIADDISRDHGPL